jgi:PAS domain S-box-containing protein
MKDAQKQPRRGWVALRDLLLISLALAGLFWLGASTDGFEGAHDWVAERFGGEGDVAVGLVLVSVGLALFSLLQWRAARGEAAARDRAEARFRTLVEKTPAVIFTWDPRDHVGAASTGYVSPQVEPILGLSVERWSSEPRPWTAHVHPHDRHRVVSAWERAARRGEPFSAEYRHVKPDGSVVWIRSEAIVVERDDAGNPSLVQGVMHDVSDRKRAEEKVAEAEARFRTLVERVPAVTYTWASSRRGPATSVPYISPQVEQLLGYTDEEFADPSLWARLVHPEDLDRVRAEWDAGTAGGGAFRCEYRMRTRADQTVWVRDEAVPIGRDDAGRTLFQGVMFDITERRAAEDRLREAEARYRAIVEHVPAAIYVDLPDLSMKSFYVSPQIEEIMGVSPQRYMDEPDLWLDLMAPEFREEMRSTYLDALEHHRSWRGEYRIVRPDGREVWVHDEMTFVADAGTPGFVQGVLFDVTERKHAEQALRDSERREREAAERLRTLDEMKNTFLAAVSHELRSPLTSILGLSLTLEQQRLSAADRRDLTRRVAQNARKLDRLLKDLLDIDRLSRGNVTPNLRPTDVGALVRGTIDSLELGDRRVVVESEDVEIPVDGPKIERVVENLVMNAVRHTEEDVTIAVRVWRGGGGAFLAVEDDGPGVPPELQSAIFEPFRQGPTAASHSPGTGIGLSLVAMFTELHGGRAWVEDREGGGASFRVFLPGEPPRDDRADRAGSRRHAVGATRPG